MTPAEFAAIAERAEKSKGWAWVTTQEGVQAVKDRIELVAVTRELLAKVPELAELFVS